MHMGHARHPRARRHPPQVVSGVLLQYTCHRATRFAVANQSDFHAALLRFFKRPDNRVTQAI
jgi:hypothetical protein